MTMPLRFCADVSKSRRLRRLRSSGDQLQWLYSKSNTPAVRFGGNTGNEEIVRQNSANAAAGRERARENWWEILPTEVGGSFKSSLQGRRLSGFFNTTHFRGWY